MGTTWCPAQHPASVTSKAIGEVMATVYLACMMVLMHKQRKAARSR